MPAYHKFCHFYNLDLATFSKKELTLLEADIFFQICKELKILIKSYYENYFNLIKFDIEKEKEMIDANFFRCIINDILASDEYNLHGIACYTNIPEDVLDEIAMGQNVYPSFFLATKIIELHRSIRPTLYREIFSKIAKENHAEIFDSSQ